MFKPFKFDTITDNSAIYLSLLIMFTLGLTSGMYILMTTEQFMSSPMFYIPPFFYIPFLIYLFLTRWVKRMTFLF
jgi:hypothetical protein